MRRRLLNVSVTIDLVNGYCRLTIGTALEGHPPNRFVINCRVCLPRGLQRRTHRAQGERGGRKATAGARHMVAICKRNR